MGALSGEPWRGAARVSVFTTLASTSNHQAWVSFDVNSSAPTGDQSTWTGTPGSSLTLRFRWASNGGGSGQQAPNFATVRAMLPGGAQIGTDWTVTFPAAGTEVTRTFHFDSDPMNGTLDAIRAGMLELYLSWGSTGGALPWSQDSRGATSGILGTNTAEWARGKARAPVTLSNFQISDVSLGGAEPATFYVTKPTFNRITLDAVWYRGAALLNKHRQSSADVRSSDADAPTDTAVQRNYTWNATVSGAGNKGRINKDYALTATATDDRIVLPANAFNGTSSDNEYVFAGSGQLAGWSTVDQSTLEKTARFTVDPRVDWDHLLQNNDNAWGSPPLTKDSGGARQTSDLGFVASRVKDRSGAGLNSISFTEKLWDTSQLTGSEASPTKTRSSTSQTQGTQPGWSDAFLTWDSALPGGSWTQKEVITSPSDLIGTEISNTRTLTLLSKNPNYAVISDGGNNPPSSVMTHWSPGRDLIIGAAIIDATLKKYVASDPSPVPFLMIGQFNLIDGKGYYLRASDLTFQPLGSGSLDSFAMSQSPTDSNVWLKTFAAAQTSAWPLFNLQFIAVLYNGGTPYAQRGTIRAFGLAHGHEDAGLEWAGVPS